MKTVVKGAARHSLIALVATGLVLGSVAALGQDYRTFKGTNARAGRATVQVATVAPETTWNNAGRGFLRWWDPIFEDGAQVDNDDPTTLGVPAIDWLNPSPTGPGPFNIILASSYLQTSVFNPPYRAAITSVTGGNEGNPTAGATRTYEWVIGGLVPGNEYEVEVNLPIGPTNVNPPGALDLRYTPHYQLYRVTDQAGNDDQWADLFVDGGGFSALGGGKIYVANAAGNITVTLYNAVRRNEFGTQIDPFDQPGVDVVYADAVRAVSKSASAEGNYVASPVVAELLNTPYIGGPINFVQRVVTARNETPFVGSLGRQFRFGEVTSFNHNGATVNVAQPLRRNMVWSWPAVRPNDLSQAESDRYAVERQNWMTGGPNPLYPRHLAFRQSDNLNAGATSSGAFVSQNVYTPVGPDYLQAPVVVAPASNVDWAPVANPGSYFVEVFFPKDDPGNVFARGARYEVLQGGVPVATFSVDQNVQDGWFRLPGQPEDGYDHTVANPLTVRLIDTSTDPNDVGAGRQVFADAVRFVGDADLGIDSTPAMEVANVHDGVGIAPRDVVVVARENGRIYCMDAHGDPATGAQPRVYWVWPSEDPELDPNNAPLEDYGIAETPPKFNMSSVMVANVGGVDLVFIGAENGRVYCLEMTGRGDGTTRRRWTYPDDFDPSNPLTPMAASFMGPIKGSLSLATVGGNPAVLIPDSTGRIVAVDAAGNAATRTTTELWRFPALPNPPVGEVAMAPVVAGGQVFFGSADAGNPTLGVAYALDENTGVLNWQRNVRNDGLTAFGLFGSASPAYVPNTIVPTETVAFVDAGGYITALNAATGGVLWEEQSVASAATGSLNFAYMRTLDPSGIGMVNAVPTILVPANSGTLLGYYADGSVNIVGNRINWGYVTEGNSQVSSFAVGGWPNALGLLANRCHLYIGDSKGILYAFSSEDDINAVPPITPGLPPGFQPANPSDPNQNELNTMIEQDDVLLLRPADFNDLSNKVGAGTLSYADITNYKANAVERRDYELGESLYVAVVDLNESTVPATVGYSVQLELSSGGRTSRALNLTNADVTGAPSTAEAGVAYGKVALLATGRSAVTVGNVTFRAFVRSGRVQGTKIALSVSPNTDPPSTPDPDFRIANPFGFAFVDAANAVTNSAADNIINPADPVVFGNGTVGNTVNATTSPWQKWEDGAALPPQPQRLSGGLLSNDVGASSSVPDGSVGVARLMVIDRSLMALILGPSRGMQGVRMNPGDLIWQPVTFPLPPIPDPANDLGIYKPLPAGYAGFEDYPSRYPNRSLDYPDLNRANIRVAADPNGQPANPVLQTMNLVPSAYTAVSMATYEGAGYENGLTRTFQGTQFDISWDLPKYQPATAQQTPAFGARQFGYTGKQTVYVDSGQPGFETADTYRRFTLGINVAPNEKLETSSKTVDLGSTPAGGGWTDAGGTVPQQPWSGASGFRPWNAGFGSGPLAQFQQYTVFNSGNTNLLNVRLSKAFGKWLGFSQIERPLELFAPGQHELAWLDGGWNLYSDLDPLLSPTARSGFDASGAIAVQKPRPGDVAPTRMSTNPRRRANANLNVVSGNLLNAAAFPPGDPFVGAAPPIGTPVGAYIRKVYPFEDYGLNADPNIPVLGYGLDFLLNVGSSEPFADPGFTLKFNVRETRMTNRSTAKAAPSVDNLVTGTEPHVWGNRQPSMMRMDNGTMFNAWSSNRLDIGGLPGFLARAKLPGDSSLQEQWRIYLASVVGSNPAGVFGQGPINDFNAWTSAGPRWNNHSLVFPAAGTWQTLFTLAPGETLLSPGDDTSARFIYPTFPNSGFRDPTSAPDTTVWPSVTQRYMAMVGETTKRDRTGAPVRLSQIILASLGFAPNGTVALGGTTTLPYDTQSIKGKPALVQTDAQNASVYYVGQANSLGELYTSSFDGTNWTQVRGLGLGDQFENLGAPSVVLRRYRNTNTTQVADVFFTGKVRGRSTAEAFTGQLSVVGNGAPVAGYPWRAMVDRFDRLEYDPASGSFWAPGVDWRLNDLDVNNFQVLMRQGTGLVNIVDNTPATRRLDRDAREMVFNTTRGGQCFVDAKRGSVKFSGTILPRNAQVFVLYSPRFVRVSGSTSAFVIDDNGTARIARSNTSKGTNYRNASAVFDERWLGILLNADPNRQDQNLTEDANFWFDRNNAAVTSGNFRIRHDRTWLALNRTSNDGGAATRPYLSSLRFGVDLPAPVAVNANGVPLNFTVDFSAAALGGLEDPFYQIDPANGRVYFTSPMEDQPVTIRYDGVDGNGAILGGLVVQATVGMVFESGEQAVPIEQASNETDISLSIDPFNEPVAGLRRPSLLWMTWSSMRNGTPDVYFQTVAPKTAPQLPHP